MEPRDSAAEFGPLGAPRGRSRRAPPALPGPPVWAGIPEPSPTWLKGGRSSPQPQSLKKNKKKERKRKSRLNASSEAWAVPSCDSQAPVFLSGGAQARTPGPGRRISRPSQEAAHVQKTVSPCPGSEHLGFVQHLLHGSHSREVLVGSVWTLSATHSRSQELVWVPGQEASDLSCRGKALAHGV